MNITFFGERVFADLIKDLEMSLSRVKMGPKPKDQHPYRRQKKRHRGKAVGRRMWRLEGHGHQPRNTWSDRKLEEAGRSLPQSPGGEHSSGTP